MRIKVNTIAFRSSFCTKYFLFIFALLGFILTLGGCDDEIAPPVSYSIEFQNIDTETSLGCGDDQNQTTSEQIEYDLVFKTNSPESVRANLTFEVSVEPEIFQPIRLGIPADGLITLEDLPWEA